MQSASPTSIRALAHGDPAYLTLAADPQFARNGTTEYVMRAGRTASAGNVLPRERRARSGTL